MLFISHDLSVRQLFDRVPGMFRGELVEQDRSRKYSATRSIRTPRHYCPQCCQATANRMASIHMGDLLLAIFILLVTQEIECPGR
jgi:ABC-type microcin C transport system duplicated ATPase subunit YejF